LTKISRDAWRKETAKMARLKILIVFGIFYPYCQTIDSEICACPPVTLQQRYYLKESRISDPTVAEEPPLQVTSAFHII
jgi:hypothetical protein